METLWDQFVWRSGKQDMKMCSGEMVLRDWNVAFDFLVDMTRSGRSRNPDFALTFAELNLTDGCDRELDSWLEAYLNELDVRGQYAQLQQVCETLLGLFDWKEDDLTDLRMRLVNALIIQEKQKEAVDICVRWYESEPDGQGKCMAAAFLIYAKIAARDLPGARMVADQYLSGDERGMEEDRVVFQAVSLLHEMEESKRLLRENERWMFDDCFEEESFLAGIFEWM